jgi:hypothetical protein
MFRLVLVLLLFGVSLSPLDARERETAQRQGGELRRDVERISQEIYPPTRGERAPPPRDARRSPPARR